MSEIISLGTKNLSINIIILLILMDILRRLSHTNPKEGSRPDPERRHANSDPSWTSRAQNAMQSQENMQSNEIKGEDVEIEVEVEVLPSADQVDFMEEKNHDEKKMRENPEEKMIGQCQFCSEVMDKSSLIKAFECEHLFCFGCLQQYFRYKIKLFQPITCPGEVCSAAVLEESHIFNKLGEDQIEKYEEMKFRKQVQSMGADFRICPDEKCKRGIIETQKGKSKAKCSTCRQVFCLKCLLKDHGGKCEGIEANLLKDKFKYKRCTKCRMVVERSTGCPHMTCKCGAQFCYNCGGKWNGSHNCIRNQINGPLFTDKLRQNLKCLRVQEYEYQNNLVGFITRIPYYIVFLFILLLWATFCLAYFLIFASLMMVAGMFSGYIFGVVSLVRSSNKCARCILFLFILFLPLTFVIAGIIMGVALILDIGKKHFLHPAFEGSIFPIFSCCCFRR